MRRNQGDHLKWNEVKAGIIEFIISSDGPVPEPEIREFLGEKYKIIDQGNIKKHLRDLQYHPYSCIDKLLTKPGFANLWDTKRIKNLSNIMLHFPDIRLNKYKKSLDIILYRHGLHQGDPYDDYILEAPIHKKYRIQLFLSLSFFNMCLTNDLETLYAKVDEICKLSPGATYWRDQLPVEKPTNKPYFEFMKRLLENPNIWLDVYNECINDPQTAVMCQTYLESSAEIRIFETIFQQILGDVLIIPSEKILDERIYKVTVEDLSNSVAYSIISSKMSKELSTKLQTRPTYILGEQLKIIKDKLSNEIFNRILGEKKWIEKTDEMMQIVKLKWRTELISMELLFDHSFQRDILEGTVSIEEKESFCSQAAGDSGGCPDSPADR